MLNDQDVQKIINAGEKVFLTNEEFSDFREELRQEFSRLYSAIDAYAKKADAYFQEMVMLSHKVDRLEKWVEKIAQKIGMKLEY